MENSEDKALKERRIARERKKGRDGKDEGGRKPGNEEREDGSKEKKVRKGMRKYGERSEEEEGRDVPEI